MLLPGKGIRLKDFLVDLKNECLKDSIDDVAGMMTFSGVLALFPFLLFMVSLAGVLINPQVATSLIEQLYQLVPKDVASILADRIRELQGGSPALLTLSGIGAIWAASGGVATLMRALNTAYGVKETRSFWKVRGLAVLVTIGGAILLIIASGLAFVTPAIAHMLEGPIGTLILWARMPVAALVMMFTLAILYYVLPDVEQKFKFITPGSVVAVIIWALTSLGFSIYVNNFGSYQVSYGALGGVIVLLMWMWISSIVVLLGAEINAIIEHRSPEGKRAGARTMAETGADVPKTIKEEELGAPLVTPLETRPRSTETSKREEARPELGTVSEPSEASPPPRPQDPDLLPAPVFTVHDAPSKLRKESPLLDALLGVGALGLGFFVGKKLRK